MYRKKVLVQINIKSGMSFICTSTFNNSLEVSIKNYRPAMQQTHYGIAKKGRSTWWGGQGCGLKENEFFLARAGAFGSSGRLL